MSRYNYIAKKLDELVKSEFKKYQDALNEYEASEKAVKAYNGKSSDPEFLRRKATEREKYENFRKAQKAFEDDSPLRVAALRAELAEKLAADTAAAPERLDMVTLELLKSGILSASEYGNLLHKAELDNNYTMRRLIAKYAGDSAKDSAAKNGENDPVTAAFRMVAAKGGQDPSRAKLAEFDALADIFARCTKNPAMIHFWDSLTGENIGKF